MKAVIQIQRSGALRVVEVPAPLPRRGQVQVANCYSLISSGTERARLNLARKSLLGKARARPDQVRLVLDSLRREGPLATYNKVMNRLQAFDPLGYSSAGQVVDVGDGVEGIRVGDLVACAGAGYANHAEVVSVPANLCVPLPGSFDRELDPRSSLRSASFATLGAIALQGIRQGESGPGDVVAVVGLGLLGTLTVQILKHAGCKVLGVDPIWARQELSRELGADAVAAYPSEAVRACLELSHGLGADCVLLTAGTESSGPIELAGELARDQGRVVVVGDVGMNVPRRVYYEKELELRLSRSYGPGRYDPTYEEKGVDYPLGFVRWTEKRNILSFLEMVGGGAVRTDPLVSHEFPVDLAKDAYRLIEDGLEHPMAVLLSYEQGFEYARSRESHADREVLATRIAMASNGPGRTSDFQMSTDAGLRSRPRRVSLAVVGAGNFAQSVLLPRLARDRSVHLRGIVSATGLSAAAAAERFGAEYAASDPDVVLEDRSVEAVVIATRHGSHADLVARAIHAGKAVFVEKPLAIRWEEIAMLQDLERRAGENKAEPFVQVGFNRRFSSHTEKLRAFVDTNPGPSIAECRVNAGPLPNDHWLHDPSAGGGRIVGEACHFIDLLIHLLGSRPVGLYAEAIPRPGVTTLENAQVSLAFADGSAATLSYATSGDRALGKERVLVSNRNGSMVIDDFRWSGKADAEIPRLGFGWLIGQGKGHKQELRQFTEALANGKASPIPLQEAVESTLWTLVIEQSVRSGRAVTRRDIDERLGLVAGPGAAVAEESLE